MPGGSGLLDQMCERFEEIVTAASDVVANCPAACDASCVDCLQTFRNAFYHKNLDRKVALDCLTAWGPSLAFAHEIPGMQPSQEQQAAGTRPVNEYERRLRHLLKAAGFEEGVRGEQLRTDPAIGTTTPDVIYRAPHHQAGEGVCIYLDGLSGHLHGNPAAADRDSRIRTWLRNNGYDVIEIAGSDLFDDGAMTRYFARLAGYLRDDRLRDRIRTQPWYEAAERATPTNVTRFTPKVVRPTPEQRYVKCVPLVPLRAAAGAFSDPQRVNDGDWDWTEVDTNRPLRPGMFVAQVVGKSMEPQIPDGSYCLFAAPVEGSRQGRTVLVELRDQKDPESGERYTVKKYSSEKVTSDDGTWRHVKIALRPNNPAFQAIELRAEDDQSVAVVAELIEVLVFSSVPLFIAIPKRTRSDGVDRNAPAPPKQE